MSDVISIVLQPTTTLGAVVVVLLSLIAYIITHPTKLMDWHVIINKIFSHFSMRAERRSIEASIQAKLKAYKNDNAVGNIMKHELKFKWMTDEQSSAYIEGDEVVVIMGRHQNEAENFLNAILQYTRMAVLSDVQNNIPESILTPIMLTMQVKMINEQRPEAIHLFREMVMHDEIEKEPTITHTMELLKELDRNRWFIPIYLNEMQYAGSRLYELPDEQKSDALNEFLQFLLNIIKRESGQEVKLCLKNKVFGLNIILVARLENIMMENINSYTKRAERAAIDGLDSVYVTGRGQTVNFTNRVINTIKSEKRVTHVWTKKYTQHDRYGTAVTLALFRNLFVQPRRVDATREP